MTLKANDKRRNGPGRRGINVARILRGLRSWLRSNTCVFIISQLSEKERRRVIDIANKWVGLERLLLNPCSLEPFTTNDRIKLDMYPLPSIYCALLTQSADRILWFCGVQGTPPDERVRSGLGIDEGRLSGKQQWLNG